VVAFRRSDEDEELVVVLNFAPEPASVSVGVDHADRDLVSGDPCVVVDGDGTERIRVDDVAVARVEGALSRSTRRSMTRSSRVRGHNA